MNVCIWLRLLAWAVLAWALLIGLLWALGALL